MFWKLQSETNFREDKKRINNKAFLGAIGDDLPSLIPLIFAVIVFLSVFTSTWNTYGQKTDRMEIFIYALKIGDIISSQDYIDNHEAFQINCEKAKAEKKYKFTAGLTKLTTIPFSENAEHLRTINYSDLQAYQNELKESGSLEYLQDSEKKFFYEKDDFGNEMHYYCSNTDKEPSKNATVQLFPVALERDYKEGEETIFFVEPMLLVIAIWE